MRERRIRKELIGKIEDILRETRNKVRVGRDVGESF